MGVLVVGLWLQGCSRHDVKIIFNIWNGMGDKADECVVLATALHFLHMRIRVNPACVNPARATPCQPLEQLRPWLAPSAESQHC